MKKVNLKQGSLAWDAARQTRIGGSEVFDIVRYYATDQELQNCGLDAEKFKEEKPFSSAWALYHKVLDDDQYHREELPPELAEYGHAAEPYGLSVLQKGRARKLHAGDVYADERLIASLDISGVAEAVDVRPFDRGDGQPKIGQRFVCEQKAMNPQSAKSGIPYKYLVQAQYQLMATGADFFILQVMVLKNDTVFERGRITQMSLKRRKEYLAENMTVSHYYFAANRHLEALIRVCLDRFFDAVEARNEPRAYIVTDSQRNIISTIRANSMFAKDRIVKTDLTAYLKAKDAADEAERERKAVIQTFVDKAMDYNACKFDDDHGNTAQFSASGAFLVKEGGA